MLHDNVLSAIGNTPLIRINRLFKSDKVTIYAKLESANPGGSVKERIALSMIEGGEASGLLTKDKIVLEATSGNTGIGLAMVCAAKGYRCVLVMPESASIERRKIMQAYGAEILLTPASRERLQGWMLGCRTGDQRLRAGVPPGWRIGEKTGTGPRGTSNDIGVLWPPGRAPVVLTCYLTGSTADGARRDAALAAVGRSVAHWVAA